MTIRCWLVVAVSAWALGLTPSLATAAQSARADVPPAPAALEVPAGHVVFLEGHAVGTQNYICLPGTSGAAWTFLGPQATLFLTTRGEFERQLSTHFLSPNPAESGTPRPTWQHSFDSSSVWARVVASSNDPGFVAPGAIPWLLLQAAGTAAGPGGASLLAKTTFIQRLNTAGGIAPATGCSATTVGTLALVPYSTDYFFYRADRRR